MEKRKESGIWGKERKVVYRERKESGKMGNSMENMIKGIKKGKWNRGVGEGKKSEKNYK